MKGFTDWINTQPKNASDKELRQIWDATDSYKNGYIPNVDKDHDFFMDQLRNGQKPSATIRPISRFNRIWRAAAMIAFLLAAGVLFQRYFSSTNNSDQIATDISERKELNLEDGTLISLNGKSSLDFPVHFSENERMVKLIGEAFFDVASEPSRPFKIETQKALGTSFNVRSFPEENFLEVFVKTGSVRVTVAGDKQDFLLSAGDLLHVYHKSSKVEKTNDESAENAIAWKSGKLTFKNKPMGEIFEALGRHFQVKFDLENPNLKLCLYTFNFNAVNLENALEGLNAACNLTFSKKADGVYKVIGSCCE